MEIERQKAASKEVEGCSFTPQLRRNASITSTSAVKARPGAVNERSTHRSNAQTAYSATTKQSTSVRRAGKWADEGPYFVDGNRAELADLSSMDMMTAEQDRNDNVADTPTRTYNDSHFFDPEEEEEAGDGLENRRAAELPLAESEGPMPRRVPVPPHSSALNRAASHSTQITAATPATRCRSPGGDAFDEGDEEQEPVSVGRLKVPLPSKSTVAPRITSATLHPQPTTISVRVPSNKNDQYEDGSDYIDYEPSPSSGVMLARSAPGNVHRKNVHFSAAWADENAHTSFGYNQYTHEEDYDEGPRTTAAVGTVEERERGREGEYYEGYEEGDYEDYDRASSQYNGLPFQVEKGRLEQHRASGQQERFTPPRSAAGSNQLFRSPPYPSASAPPLRFRTHSGPEAPEVSAGLFPHQHHQQQHQGQHSYSFAGLAEPEDAEFAHFSLFDVGQLELHADASYSAADSSTHLPPPPPPPLEDVEDVRKYAQQPAVLIRGSLPPPYASASGEGNALAASQNSRAALPLHTQYRQKQQEHSTHDHHPGERSPSNNNEHLSCDVYGDDGYGEAVEFSPSPSKVSFPHQLAYDML